MPDKPDPNLTFSQRTGLKPVPPQLKLGEISDDLRRRLHYAFSKSMGGDIFNGRFDSHWNYISRDLYVLFFKESPDKYENDSSKMLRIIKLVTEKWPFNEVFDLVEFILSNKNCEEGVRDEIAHAFVECRAAYRVVDGRTIVAIGTDEQAEAFVRALDDTANSATAARTHLIAAGTALRNGDWAGCVRESIHAVESVAVRLAPGTNILGDALKVIEKKGHLHGALKAAFERLYGYSSDEKGVRHALVFESEAQVDEADALFMLGACASFVSYLLARAG